MKRIGIDARMYGPKTGGGGLGRYVEELVKGLQKHDQQNRYVVFLQKQNFDECKLTNPNFEKRLADVHWYGLREQVKMPRIIDRENLDLVHYPHWNVPLRAKTPFVVTIHDLILMEEPHSAKVTTRHPFIFQAKYFGYKRAIAYALKKSKAIIAVSEYTRDSILKHFSLPETKIQVIYEGVTVPDKSETVANIESKGVKKPYFLYVGNAYPHKNLETLIHAFSFFHKLHPEVQLVLVGKPNVFYDRLEKEVGELDIAPKAVKIFGFATDAELRTLYEHAKAYVFPSRCEGFGLPPLEAMVHDVPVIASNRSCLPEILGNAATYFDPDDVEQMVEAMEKILTDPDLREKQIKKGQDQYKKYSWDKMSKEIIDLYARLYAEKDD